MSSADYALENILIIGAAFTLIIGYLAFIGLYIAAMILITSRPKLY